MNLHAVAERLLQEYDARHPGLVMGEMSVELTISRAYELQFAVAALRESRGERIAGYKVGCISETMQRQLGIDEPVFGHIWRSELHSSGASLSARNYMNLAVEGELAVMLRDDVPSASWLSRNPDVVAGLCPVIELHNYVFHGRETERAVDLIANNAIHAGVVKHPHDEKASLANAADPVRVERNGEALGESIAEHVAENSVGIVAAVCRHLEEHGRHLRKNQIILTGSPLPLWPVGRGDLIRVSCGEARDVSCHVVE